MSKHTPGPWKLLEEPEYPSLVGVVMSNGKEVNYCAALSCPEEVANARLIAAAPDLLSALKNLIQFYCGDEDMNAPQWVKAKEAVSKAEGAGRE